MNPEEANPARVRILGRLDEMYKMLEILTVEKTRLEGELETISKSERTAKFVNRFIFSAYPPIDSGPWKTFLRGQMLQGMSTKHPEFEYNFVEKDGLVREIYWTETDEKRTKEIINACKWTEARTRERGARL